MVLIVWEVPEAMKPKTIEDCQHEAVVLSGLIKAIDLLEFEGKEMAEARCSLTIIARERAQALADALDKVKPTKAVVT